MMNNKKLIYILKIISTFILFLAALNHENALNSRTFVYLLMFSLYLLANVFRYYSKNHNQATTTFLVELCIIYLFEYNSRYQVNYIFHLFYFLTLLEVPTSLNKKQALFVSIITIIISNIKFIILLYLKPGFGNIAQGGFFLLTGICISLLINFISYYKEEEEKKKVLNMELREANIRLNEMAIFEERNRIARDLHDTLGHSLMGNIMGLDMVQVLLDEDLARAKDMIVNLRDSSRENLVKVREVVSTLNPNENISKGIESIEELVNSFKNNSNIEIDFIIEGAQITAIPSINIVLYRIIQEALTNAIRHGKADKLMIKISYRIKSIDLYIKDNGIGVKSFTKGYGIRSMEDRVFSVGGTISFSSLDGFSIVVRIPWEVEHD